MVLVETPQDLQPSDILKAELLHALPESESAAFAEFWLEMEGALGREELQTFLVDVAQVVAQVALAPFPSGTSLPALSFQRVPSGTFLPALSFRHFPSGTFLPALSFRHFPSGTFLPAHSCAPPAAQVPQAGASPGHAFGTLTVLTDKLKKSGGGGGGGGEGGLSAFARQYLPDALKAYRIALCMQPYGGGSGSRGLPDDDVNAALLALNYSGWRGSGSIRREWAPLAMRMVMLHGVAPAVLAEMLRDLDRTAAYLTMCVSNAKAREKRYDAALRQLKDAAAAGAGAGGGAAVKLTALALGGDEMAAMREECKSPNLHNKTKAVKLVLLRLDLALREGPLGAVRELMSGSATVTVEHVLPQKPAAGSRWLRDFPDADERDALTHTLGNLVLLPRSKNAKASNAEFEEKKSTYFCNRDRTSSVSEFALTNTVMRHTAWTPEAVHRRQSEMLRVLYKAWRLE